ncbi:peptidyl-prolyl cis-trans isomerase FKBP4-like [Acanthaster planci]|uniref:peptidylprolyl isomerase n=1 Tax=Acanthaster planci TaxID=133434 RepID=A0A8B7ZLD6_ACAPL|nr:peptidyl-prolyl cis-trans isomerase FKBP4-like [Acanthaster planci]
MAVENVAETSQKHPLAGTGEDITPNKDGGVLKSIIKEGDTTENDRPMKGDTVHVHYVGTLMNGEEFDSSRKRNEQFSFKLGEGRVIKGWDLGVATMRRGEVCVLTCSPEYAYGKNGQGKIPADATLVFEVELFDWSGEDLSDDKDGGIIHRVITVGKGFDKPKEDSSVTVHIVGKHGDTVFDERDVSFVIGEGSEHNLPKGLEKGIQEMLNEETAQFTIKPKYGFGSKGCAEWNVPPDATIKYQVTLSNLVKAKESWEMDHDEKLSAAEKSKAKGTEYFKAGNYKKAIKQYTKILDYLDSYPDIPEEQKASYKELVLAGHLNLAMAYIKNKDNAEAVKSCDKALKVDPDNVKGLFRRGQANLAMSDPILAKKDFNRVVELDPENKAAKNQVTICLHQIKQAAQKEKRLYSNMFEKFAEQDRKAEALKKSSDPPQEFGGVFNKEDVEQPSDKDKVTDSGDGTSETKTESMEAEV